MFVKYPATGTIPSPRLREDAEIGGGLSHITGGNTKWDNHVGELRKSLKLNIGQP